MYASEATLAAIAVERYYIMFFYTIRKTVAKYILIIIWVVAILLSIPQVTFLNTINVSSGNYLEHEEEVDEVSFVNGSREGEEEAKYMCDIVWPDRQTTFI